MNISRVLRRHDIPAQPVSTGTTSLLYFDRGSGGGFASAREVERVRAIDIHPTAMHLPGLEPGRLVDGVLARELLLDSP